MKERLQKIIRNSGIASRREAEKWITSGRISIDGVIVTELGTQADQETQVICIDGVPLRKSESHVYYLFYKPTSVVTTLHDPQGRPTIVDFIKEIPERIFPVGRLDQDTEGLLVLTNDGNLMNGLLHPSREIPKIYQVKVKGIPDEKTLNDLRNGVELTDGKTAPAKVKFLKSEKDTALLEIIIHEGKNRQVRRMVGTVGFPAVALKRIGFAFLRLDGLTSGSFRPLSQEEVNRLREWCGI